MQTVKSLILAGVTVLSLGAGSVMAQEMPTFATTDVYVAPQAAPAASNIQGQVKTFAMQAHQVADFTLGGGESGGS